MQEVAFSRNVNGVLVWQFDQRLLQRAGGALNYGRVTVRCIWPLQDGYCFHSLMTGRFGAPANQGLSDWMDADWRRQSAARRGLAALQPLHARCRPPARSGKPPSKPSSAHAPAAEIDTEGRRRGINATVVAAPADVLADPHLARARILAVRRWRNGARPDSCRSVVWTRPARPPRRAFMRRPFR